MLTALLAAFLSLATLGSGPYQAEIAARFSQPEPKPVPTPVSVAAFRAAPTAVPAPTPSPGPISTATPPPSVVQQVVHRLLFPAETIGQALTNVFNQAAGKEAESLSGQAAAWGETIGESYRPLPKVGSGTRLRRACLLRPPWPRLSSCCAWRSIIGTD
ncbi:MAG: hypothetical protein P8074_23770 [Anaerolineales bacterium]